jgi:hypothetical protein
MRRALLVILPLLVPFAHAYTAVHQALPAWSSPSTSHAARVPAVVAAAKKQEKKRSTPNALKYVGRENTDYVRGTFGIGENESKVIWGIVFAALVFGGGLSEEQAQKIGAAQRSVCQLCGTYSSCAHASSKSLLLTLPRPSAGDAEASWVGRGHQAEGEARRMHRLQQVHRRGISEGVYSHAVDRDTRIQDT